MNKHLLIKEIKELWEQKKFQMLIFFFVAIALFANITTKLAPEIFSIIMGDKISELEFSNLGLIKKPHFRTYLDAYNKYMTQFGIAILLLAFNGNIIKDLITKTIYNLIALGISKTQFLIAKYIAMIISISLVLMVATITFILFLQLNLVNIDFNMLVNITLVILGKYMFLIALVTFYSTIVQSESYVGIFAISTYLIIFISQYVGVIKFINPFYYISNTLEYNYLQILQYSMLMLLWNATLIITSLKRIKIKEI